MHSIITQLVFLTILLLSLFFIFEIIPLLFIKKNTITKNLPDFIKYQVIRGYYTLILGSFFVSFFSYTKINIGLLDIRSLSVFSQVIIIYFFSEFTIYSAHRLAHTKKIPILSKAHNFHHTIKEDIEWVNSRKEHYLVLSLFTFVFSFFFFVIFKSSIVSHQIVIALYFTLNAFSHYRVPITIPLLNYIFLFPKEHHKHHSKWGGPYGVTLSLFDTIFDTNNNK